MKKTTTPKKSAFFLDRDGTINIDRVYINDPDLIELIPGAAKAIKRAQDEGYLIVVVTNQSGVGRGLIKKEDLPKINARLDELLLKKAGARIDLYQICMHAPQENCDCRKPKPKLVLEAAEKLGIDLKKSVFVGDKLSDVATGKKAGCGLSILLRTGKGQEQEIVSFLSSAPKLEEKANYVADDLLAAVNWVLDHSRLASSRKRGSQE